MRRATFEMDDLTPDGPLLRDIAELDDPDIARERMLRLAGARVLFAEHALLQRDFPRLRTQAWIEREPGLASLAPGQLTIAVHERIDAWLLRQAAWISVPQAAQQLVNGPVTTGAQTRPGWRPPRYGRAAVVATDDGPGLLDLKGVGVPEGQRPRLASHANGLCLLEELLREICFNWMLAHIFTATRVGAATSVGFWCVPNYGLIDAGFDARRFDRPTWSRAAVLVRRAHRRPRGGIELPRVGDREEQLKFEVEMLLRSYGLTSTNNWTRLHVAVERGQPRFVYHDRVIEGLSRERALELLARLGPAPIIHEGVNVQFTRDIDGPGCKAQLIDFGQYEWRERFELPVASLVRDRELRWGGAIRPGDRGYVQPHPRLQLPGRLWSAGPLLDFVAELAEQVRTGRIAGASLRAALADRIAQSVAGWS